VARATGHYHSYHIGTPGTVANVRRVQNTLGTSANVWQINSFVYDQWLCTVDGRNAPMKYGQHFLEFTNNELTTPFLFPIGSKPISPMIGDVSFETWTYTGTSGSVADASVPGGGSRVGTHSIKVGPADRADVAFATPRNFTSGPEPHASRDFVTTDSLAFQYLKAATAGNLIIHFVSDAHPTTTNFKSFTLAQADQTANNTWQQATILRSAGVDTGTPVMTAIRWVRIENQNDAVNDVYVDDLYWLYSDAPPAAQVGVTHKDRIVLGGSPLIGDVPSLGTIIYSNAEAPDNFATAGVNNTQIIGGGVESLAKTNQITALREYQDSVIVGTPSAIFAWTVGAAGIPAKSTISTEHGIDSHRGLIETPNGALLFPWQRGIYILRSTGRQFIGAKIQPFLADITTDDMSWSLAVLDEKTKTIRYWFR